MVTYYEEVESYRVNGKVVQKHIKSLERDRESPDSFPVERVHFGYIATRLMQSDLSPNELLDMVGKIGHRVSRENLERIGLYYDFKKTPFPVRSTGKDQRGSGKMQIMRQKTKRILRIFEDHQNPVQ